MNGKLWGRHEVLLMKGFAGAAHWDDGRYDCSRITYKWSNEKSLLERRIRPMLLYLITFFGLEWYPGFLDALSGIFLLCFTLKATFFTICSAHLCQVPFFKPVGLTRRHHQRASEWYIGYCGSLSWQRLTVQVLRV